MAVAGKARLGSWTVSAHSRIQTCALCVVLILSVFVRHTHAGSVFEGRVVGVADGDTITVLVGSHEQIKVRLAEIDAPEKAQPFGQRSKQALSDMVFGKTVRVEQQDRDRYGRVVGRVFVDGTDVNVEQIRQGMAWAYRQYLRDTALLTLEKEAKDAQRGLWLDPYPVPPWEYRHGGQGKFRGVDAPPRAERSMGDDAPARGASHPAPLSSQQPERPSPGDSPAWPCGAKRYCGQMTSCEEARYYLTQCGVRSLDGDGNGIPCESLCGGRR